MLELVKRDGLARICRLHTRQGELETPCLLPVINPRLITISPRELYDVFGFRALITNSYIIRGDPKIREDALSKGLHELLDFPGVIMTDSGTFQSHMYGEVDLINKEIVEFQRDIGSDIGTVLDILPNRTGARSAPPNPSRSPWRGRWRRPISRERCFWPGWCRVRYTRTCGRCAPGGSRKWEWT